MTIYWQQKGKINSEATVEKAIEQARHKGIKDIVVASASGYSASLCLGHEDLNIICVARQAGFGEPGVVEMSAEMERRLHNGGIKVLRTTHLMAGLDRSLRFAFQGIYPAEIIANTLRLFGQGTKVAVEIAVMALDAGLVPHGVDVMAIAGTSQGADTALILRPSHSQDFFASKIKEIVCKPRDC